MVINPSNGRELIFFIYRICLVAFKQMKETKKSYKINYLVKTKSMFIKQISILKSRGVQVCKLQLSTNYSKI